MDNQEILHQLEDALTGVANLLDQFDETQNDDSDLGNEEHISEARNALENLRSHTDSLVP
jgi:septation ring formation regulator EzrA